MQHRVSEAGAVGRRRPPAVARAYRVSAALLLLVAALGWAVAQPDGPMQHTLSAVRLWVGGPVYTVAEVERQMALAPRGWLGRTILVQGRLGYTLVRLCPGDPVCIGQPILVDAAPVGAADPWPLALGGPDPLRAALHQLPLLGHLLPLAHQPRWGVVQTYWVRLDAAAAASCAQAVCYNAVLLDVAPADVCYWRHHERLPVPCGP